MEKSMKVGIVDDEITSVNLIEALVGRLPYFSVCLTSTDPLESLEQVRKSPPDIMILDVQMAGLDGLAFAAELLTLQIPVILISGQKLEAQDPFDLEVVDFVAKPVKIGRMTKALNKARMLAQYKKRPIGDEMTEVASQPDTTDFIMVRPLKSKGFAKLMVSEIDYIKGDGDTPIVMVENEKYFCDKSLSQLEIELKKFHLIRVHRSYIVNLRQVSSVDQEHVYFKQSNYENIPIGRTYKDEFLQYFRERYVY